MTKVNRSCRVRSEVRRGNRIGSHWCDRDYRILDFLFPRIGAERTAKRLKRSVESIEARAADRGLIRSTAPRRPTPKDVREALRLATESTGISADAILGRSRQVPVVKARWIAFKALRDRRCSLPGIGAALGVDHSTVHHGLKSMAELPDRGVGGA